MPEGFNGRIFVDSGSAGFKSFDIEIRRAAERIIGGSFVLFGEWFDLPRDITVEDEWRTDFVAGYRFPDGPYDAIKPESGVADIKVPWEYGRMQYLLPLAAAFRQTGDARFLDCYRAKVGSFASVNLWGGVSSGRALWKSAFACSTYFPHTSCCGAGFARTTQCIR